MYNLYPPLRPQFNKIEMDYDKILKEPFEAGVFSWPTSAPRNTVLGAVNLPLELLNSELLQTAFERSCLFRSKILLEADINGTPMHAGIVRLSIMPSSFDAGTITLRDPNMLSQCPFVDIVPTQTSAVVVGVPNYHSSTLMSTSNFSFDRCGVSGTEYTPYATNYATAILWVLNPLVPATGATTTLKIALRAYFKELEFFVPRCPNLYPPPGSTVSSSLSAFSIRNKTNSKGFKSQGLCTNSSVSTSEIALATALSFSASLLSRVVFALIVSLYKRRRSGRPSKRFTGQGIDSGPMPTFQSRTTEILDDVASYAKNVTTDLITDARAWVKRITGFHNPNIPNIQKKNYMQQRNNAWTVDRPTAYDRLDPFQDYVRMYSLHDYHTNVDEMELKHLTSKKQKVGTFTVSSTDDRGTLLWSRPITPFQDVLENGGTANMLEIISSMAQAWSGRLKLSVQSSMTSFQNLKLLVSCDYSCAVEVGTSKPVFENLFGLVTCTMEFTGGGEWQCCDLEYYGITPHLPVALDARTNARIHGMYYISVLQPLSIAPNQPTTAEFNVYISGGDDFSLYGYKPIMLSQPGMGPIPTVDSKTFAEPRRVLKVKQHKNPRVDSTVKSYQQSSQHQQQQFQVPSIAPQSTTTNSTAKPIAQSTPQSTSTSKRQEPKMPEIVFRPQGCDDKDKVREAQEQIEKVAVTEVTCQDCVHPDLSPPVPAPFPGCIRPLTHVQDIARRLEPYEDLILELEADNPLQHSWSIGVAALLGLDLTVSTNNVPPPLVLRSLYYGHVGGIKCKLIVAGASNVTVTYVPPTPYAAADAGMLGYRSVDQVPAESGIPLRSLPIIEGANYFNTGANNISMPHGTTVANRDGGPVHVVEFEIPFVNASNFCAFPARIYYDHLPYSTALGDIYITVRPISVRKNGEGAGSEYIDIVPSAKIMVGFSDEARFGMQCFSLWRKFPASNGSWDYPGLPVREVRRNAEDNGVQFAYFTKN